MKNPLFPIITLSLLNCLIGPTIADEKSAPTPPAAPVAPIPAKYEIQIDYSQEPALKPVAEKLEKLFHQHYPGIIKMLEAPGQKIPQKVTLTFEKALKIPGQTAGPKMQFGVDWFLKHPNDLGVLIHELAHTIQAYPNSNPWWVTEGLADYVREKFSVDPPDVWSLPKLNASNRYDQGYRVTAAFLIWAEKKYPAAKLPEALNQAMKDKKYTPDIWKSTTGKSLDDLWKECLADQKP
jgi:hypothetical protein